MNKLDEWEADANGPLHGTGLSVLRGYCELDKALETYDKGKL